MKTVQLVQGKPEWHAFRQTHFTASDASAMLCLSKYKTRDQLMVEKCEGVTEEITPQKQALFDKGHAAEEAARPLVEAIIGDELFPATAVSDDWEKLAASFDGVTMLDDIIFEHKLWNKKLVEYIATHKDLPDTHWPQLEHQLLVSGAEKCLLRVSDGTEDNAFDFEYFSNADRAARVYNGWKIFEEDMANYKPKAAKQEVVAKVTVETLPQLVVEIEGKVNSSNLAVYKEGALELIAGINTDLKTDQDFADADKMTKFCAKAEKNIKSVKEKAMQGAASINDLFESLDDIQEAMRQKRLELEKLVKNRKEEIKRDEIEKELCKVEEYTANLEKDLDYSLGFNAQDFRIAANTAIKGKRNIDSITAAISATGADIKGSIKATYDRVKANSKLLDEQAEYIHLFSDAATFITQETVSVQGIIAMRVNAEKERLDKIRQQEEEKAKLAAQETPKIPSEIVKETGEKLPFLLEDDDEDAAMFTDTVADNRPDRVSTTESHTDDVLAHNMCEYMKGAMTLEQAHHVIRMVRNHQ